MKKRIYWGFAGGLLLVVTLFLFISASGTHNHDDLKSFRGDIAIYKSANCGCCGIYGSYFKSRGNSNAKVITVEDIDSIKSKYNVPAELQSCHTTIVGNYFVEGHIPLKAVNKLLEERPDIAGIAMPGMPSGSPGMPGTKKGDFVIYSVNRDGSYGEFMRI